MSMKLKPVPEQEAWLARQLEINGLQSVITTRGKTNPCVQLYGPGPADAKCKQCRLFKRKGNSAKTYFKCELRGDTNGAGTDHRANWPACKRFVPLESNPTPNPQ